METANYIMTWLNVYQYSTLLLNIRNNWMIWRRLCSSEDMHGGAMRKWQRRPCPSKQKLSLMAKQAQHYDVCFKRTLTFSKEDTEKYEIILLEDFVKSLPTRRWKIFPSFFIFLTSLYQFFKFDAIPLHEGKLL